MSAWELFRRYLLSPRDGSIVRTTAWISMVSIALGVFALLVVASVMSGFNSSIRGRLMATEPDLTVLFPVDLTPEMEAIVAGAPGAKSYSFELQDVIVRTEDGLFSGAIAKGFEASALRDMLQRIGKARAGASTVASAAWGEEASRLGKQEVLMGTALARRLELFEGEPVLVMAPESLISSVDEAPISERVHLKGLVSTDVAEGAGQMIYYVKGQSFLRLAGTASWESGLEVFLPHGFDRQGLTEKFRSRGARVETWEDRNAALFFALKLEKIAMTTFLSLTVLITGFSVFTVLLLLLTQKRADLGVMMAMGLSRSQCRRLFLRVGLCLSALGMGVGIAGGVVVSLVMEKFPLRVLPEDVYYDASIPSQLDLGILVGVILACLALAWSAAWLPVWSQTKSEPSELLRSGKV